MTLIELIKTKSPREHGTIMELIEAIEIEQVTEKVVYYVGTCKPSNDMITGDIEIVDATGDVELVDVGGLNMEEEFDVSELVGYTNGEIDIGE